jgi:hypothetical protein
MDPATVTVQLQPADIRKFSQFAGRSPRRVWLLFLVAFMFFGTSLVLRLQGARTRGSDLQHTFVDWATPLAPIFIFGVTFVAIYWWRVTSRGNYQKRYPGAFLPTTFSTLDEGLYVQNDRGEILHYWKIIERLGETPDYFFLMIGQRTGHIIPKRCFNTQEAAAVFANQLRLYLEKHAPTALAGRLR